MAVDEVEVSGKKRKPKLRSLAYLQVTGGSPQVYDWQEGIHMEQSSAAARGVFESEGGVYEGASVSKEPKVYSLASPRGHHFPTSEPSVRLLPGMAGRCSRVRD